MSLDNFIAYLQQLLSMIDPANEYSVALGKCALSATIALARASDKVNGMAWRAMVNAERNFSQLALHAGDFAGVPGQYRENEQKRNSLKNMLFPHC